MKKILAMVCVMAAAASAQFSEKQDKVFADCMVGYLDLAWHRVAMSNDGQTVPTFKAKLKKDGKYEQTELAINIQVSRFCAYLSDPKTQKELETDKYSWAKYFPYQ